MSRSDREIAATVLHEQDKLRSFVRRRVRDAADADDIVQEVFYEFVAACRLPAPIEHASAWLFRVARNRIVDLFRKKKEQSIPAVGTEPGEDEAHRLDLLLPASGDAESDYARAVLLRAFEAALTELPPEQRDIFIAHELNGVSFKQLARQSGVAINTLLARKRYAVLHLRERLQSIYDDFDM